VVTGTRNTYDRRYHGVTNLQSEGVTCRTNGSWKKDSEAETEHKYFMLNL